MPDNIRYHEMTTLTLHNDDDDASDYVRIEPSSTFLKGFTNRLAFAITAACFSSAFQHGYNTGVVNTPRAILEEFINKTYIDRHGEPLNESTLGIIWSTTVAIFCFGGMIGGLLTAVIAERFGRKMGLMLNNINVFVATILMAFSKLANSYEMIIAGRFFIGICSGLNAGLVPMYLNEITPANYRGAVGTTYQLVVTISILLAQILSMPKIMGTEDLWPLLFAFTIIPAIFQVIALPFCPESPKYILLNQGKEIKAQQAIVWLRGTTEIQDEVQEMRQEIDSLKEVPKVTIRDMLYNPLLRFPLIISIMMMLSQQLSGINAVIFFSTTIFQNAGLKDDVPVYATLGMGVINVLMTVVSLGLIEKAGRKTLHMVGLGGTFVATLLLAICIQTQESAVWVSYISIVLVFAFIIMFATGPGSIPWFLVAELFSQGPRSLATSIAVGINWLANFIVALGFVPLSDLLHGYVFLIFAGLLGFFFFFTYKYVPETKNKSSEDMAAYFRQKIYKEAPYTEAYDEKM